MGETKEKRVKESQRREMKPTETKKLKIKQEITQTETGNAEKKAAWLLQNDLLLICWDFPTRASLGFAEKFGNKRLCFSQTHRKTWIHSLKFRFAAGSGKKSLIRLH